MTVRSAACWLTQLRMARHNERMNATHSSIADLRKSYERAELSEDASHADPLQQFDQWLGTAEGMAYYELLKQRFKVQIKAPRPTP